MKKLISIIVILLITRSIFADSDITKFLGIPIDGTKTEMIHKLCQKGFVPKQINDIDFLEGEFNGTLVHLYIGTNNNKVWRIMLTDASSRSEEQIKIRFNNLVRQFKKNKRYRHTDNDYTIPEDEDIQYQMSVNKKVYRAQFVQKTDIEYTDSLSILNQVINELKDNYSEEELQNPSDFLKNWIKLRHSVKVLHLLEATYKNSVWFCIYKDETKYNQYYISMYYDNEFNHADGEDL